jgi:hypothetical protein
MATKKRSEAMTADLGFKLETVKMLTSVQGNVETLVRRSSEDRETVKQVAANLQVQFNAHADDDKQHFMAVREEQKRMAKVVNFGLGGVAMLQFVILAVLAAWKLII